MVFWIKGAIQEADYGTWILWISVSIMAILSMAAMYAACEFIYPGLMVSISSLDIVFALIIQVVQFHEIPHYIAVLGAILVIGSISVKVFEP